MSDLVDRQAAIDEIKALYEWHDTVTEDRAVDHLKRLPSAQPEIIRCKDCKYFAGEGMYCENDIIVHFDHFYCYNAERRTDE